MASKLEALYDDQNERIFQLDYHLIRLLQLPNCHPSDVKATLDNLTAKLKTELWPRPRNNLSSNFHKEFAWQSHILKIHQVFATITRPTDDIKQPHTPQSSALQSSATAKFESSQSVPNSLKEDVVQTNLTETVSLLLAGSVKQQGGDQPVYGRHLDTRYSDDIGDQESEDSSSSEVHLDSEADKRSDLHIASSSVGVRCYIRLVDGAWSGVNDVTLSSSAGADDDSTSSTDVPPNQWQDKCDWDEEEQICTLLVDVDATSMGVSSKGRFDAYLWAMFCVLAWKARDKLKVQVPLSLRRCWKMAVARSWHGLRVMRDACGGFRITQAKYEWYVTLLTSGSLKAVQDTFHDLANEVWHAQFSKADTESNKRLERLLVALLGHDNDMVRSQAAVFLNNLYDQHDWQQDVPFMPVVKCAGEPFKLTVVLTSAEDPTDDVILILSAPSFAPNAAFETYTYHFLKWERISSARNRWKGLADFGTFPRCGYYDWRLVRADEQTGSWETIQSTAHDLQRSSYSFLNTTEDVGSGLTRSRNLYSDLLSARRPVRSADDGPTPPNHYAKDAYATFPLQGRFLVHPPQIRHEQVHELLVDLFDARFDKGNLTQTGNFTKVAASLAKTQQDGVTALFLTGCLARDNGDAIFTPAGEQKFERPEASPFAVTCRATPCALLGGPRGFSELIREARNTNVKIIVDSLARVSSSRAHRKYWPHILHSIDSLGKRIMLYGTEGRSISFEETCQLNYRKVESWDLLVKDISTWATRYNVDGVRLDNAHLMPQILKTDHDELARLDADGQPHYMPEEKLMGEIVLPSTDSMTGYWKSSAADSHWPNPLMVRLCRDLWRKSRNFIIVGDCGLSDESTIKRLGIMSRSGFIPQIRTLPETLCRLFGKRIESSGVVVEDTIATVSLLSDWFEKTHEQLPDGAVTIQSSCSHSSPYPALLYGRGAWPATDLLFFSSDIPATCMGETEGSSFRVDVANFFKSSSAAEVEEEKSTAYHFKRPMSTARSMLNLDESTLAPTSSEPSNSPTSPNGSRLFGRARSLAKFEPLGALKSLEEENILRVGPQYGFDLRKICTHYQHRRQLRKAFAIFASANMLPLRATDLEGNTVPSVFAFCRLDAERDNLILGAINFASEPVPNVCLNVRFLYKHFRSREVNSDACVEIWSLFDIENTFDPTVCKFVEQAPEDILNSISENKLHLRTLSEVLGDYVRLSIAPYASYCLGLKILKPRTQTQRIEQQRALHACSLVTLDHLIRTKATDPACSTLLNNSIKANFIRNSLITAIEAAGDVTLLGSILAQVAENSHLVPDFSFFRLLVDGGLLDAGDQATAFYAKIEKILEACSTALPQGLTATQSAVYKLAKECKESNSLGPVVFMTAELGKWSTVGGLGVMVDELALTLVSELGQEAWVISPYYERNRRGERDYLKRDGIEWKFNVTVDLGGSSVTLGVHEGKVKDVRLFFVHNAEYFPQPYPDNKPLEAVKLLAVIGKSFLEVLCQLKSIPQVIVTNDWTTGLVPAFARHGAFGDAFKSSTFFHIIHNFDPTYEGRIFPPTRDGYQWVHGLPHHLLVDPLWSQTIVNPSRCALLSCNNWGTVSRSYRDDLLANSPLAPLLKRFPKPFATPNGIPISARVAKLKQLPVPSHQLAKGWIQSTYFGFETPDLDIPIFSFIGRITAQKGVHLILEAAESIITRYNHRIQILVGGKVNWSDPYSARCGNHMYSLKDRYPWSFYADPNEFFTNGTIVNLGSDFGLMPSLFEPGGIVQHEFFVAGTPVIAYRTGGLKDTVSEFDLENQKGNGFTFAAYNLGDFIYAVERAIRVFNDEGKYKRLRQNCFESTVSCEASATEWLGEFYRIRSKLLINSAKLAKIAKSLPKWKIEEVSSSTASVTTGIMASAGKPSTTTLLQPPSMRKAIKVKFVPNKATRPRSVAVSGSFDDWRVRRPLSWDNSCQAFTANIALPLGRHLFKFVVDGDWVCGEGYPSEKDTAGILNNVLVV